MPLNIKKKEASNGNDETTARPGITKVIIYEF